MRYIFDLVTQKPEDTGEYIRHRSANDKCIPINYRIFDGYSSYSGDVPKMMSDECDDDTDTGGD